MARAGRRDVVIVLVNAAAVLFMAGFIWTMQLVHYPLFDRVGASAFSAYETAHNRLFFRVAGPGVRRTPGPASCCSSSGPRKSRFGQSSWGSRSSR